MKVKGGIEMAIGLHRPAYAEVSLEKIRNNFKKIKENTNEGTQMIAVVKADGYGHGAVAVAKSLVKAGADYLAVAVSDEAIELRQSNVESRLMVLGLTQAEDASLHAELDIELTLSDLEWLKNAHQTLKENQVLKLHLKMDSGMSRIGVRTVEEGQVIIDYIAQHQDDLQLVSVFTHMSSADSDDVADIEQTRKQIEAFKAFRKEVSWSKLSRDPFFHQSNSAMTLWYPEETLDAVRPGIALYGINPSNGGKELPYSLEAAMEVKAIPVYQKVMTGGEKVSYGATYEASEGEVLVTLPIGYADGWQRRYLGFEIVGENGVLGESVGRVCMDQTIVKLNRKLDVFTPLTLMGEHLTAEEIGRRTGTIGYEIVCLFGERLPRYY